METCRLGASDLELTRVGLGAWAIGGLMWGGSLEAEAADAIRAGLDAGINWIDTAPAYGCGRSEEIVGRVLRGRRDGVIVATKCGLRWDRTDGDLRFEVEDPGGGGRVRIHYNLRPESLREECEASLRRLGVDAIDLYQIHWPYPPHPLEDAFGELVRLREEGKLRWLGACNFQPEDLEIAQRVGGIVCLQSPYNLVDRRIEARVLPWCREHGVAVTPYSPMARGLLTGAVGPGREFATSDHRAHNPAFASAERERVARALERARPIARAHGVGVANLAVAWVLATPGVVAAPVGARTAAQARENARAADVVLSADEVAELSSIFPLLPWAPSKPGR